MINGVNVPCHPSQLFAAGIEGLFVFAVAIWFFRHQKRSGMTTAAVCIVYGFGRFIDEFWRQPDLGQPVFWEWMSKGQLLTIPMIHCGGVDRHLEVAHPGIRQPNVGRRVRQTIILALF